MCKHRNSAVSDLRDSLNRRLRGSPSRSAARYRSLVKTRTSHSEAFRHCNKTIGRPTLARKYSMRAQRTANPIHQHLRFQVLHYD